VFIFTVCAVRLSVCRALLWALKDFLFVYRALWRDSRIPVKILERGCVFIQTACTLLLSVFTRLSSVYMGLFCVCIRILRVCTGLVGVTHAFQSKSLNVDVCSYRMYDHYV